ncbi:MAG: hypothetical protein WCS21_10160 [Lachnospiraceae bacterium]
MNKIEENYTIRQARTDANIALIAVILVLILIACLVIGHFACFEPEMRRLKEQGDAMEAEASQVLADLQELHIDVGRR